MSEVYLNGRFLDEREATLSVADAGLQHGVGVFETLLGGCGDAGNGEQGWAMLLDEHVQRLAMAAHSLGLATLSDDGMSLGGMQLSGLSQAIRETARRSGLTRCRLRLTLTGGEVNLLRRAQGVQSGSQGAASGAGAFAGTVLIVASPATQYPQSAREQGILATLADTRVSPLDIMAGHKTLNYWWRLRELGLAAGKGAGEALVFSVRNHLSGGCVSNAILIRKGEALTPIARGEEGRVDEQGLMTQHAPGDAPADEALRAEAVAAASATQTTRRPGVYLPSPTLSGITRAWAIQELAGMGVLTRRRMVTISDVLEADEVMLTNSSWGVLGVSRVEGATIGAGAAGSITRELTARWERAVDLGKLGGI